MHLQADSHWYPITTAYRQTKPFQGSNQLGMGMRTVQNTAEQNLDLTE